MYAIDRLYVLCVQWIYGNGHRHTWTWTSNLMRTSGSLKLDYKLFQQIKNEAAHMLVLLGILPLSDTSAEAGSVRTERM